MNVSLLPRPEGMDRELLKHTKGDHDYWGQQVGHGRSRPSTASWMTSLIVLRPRNAWWA